MRARVGGTPGGAEPAVRDNLGLGLLSRAGVAIGLALISAGRFSRYGVEAEALVGLVLSVVTATTFVLQMIGPIGTKLAVSCA